MKPMVCSGIVCEASREMYVTRGECQSVSQGGRLIEYLHQWAQCSRTLRIFRPTIPRPFHSVIATYPCTALACLMKSPALAAFRAHTRSNASRETNSPGLALASRSIAILTADGWKRVDALRGTVRAEGSTIWVVAGESG